MNSLKVRKTQTVVENFNIYQSYKNQTCLLLTFLLILFFLFTGTLKAQEVVKTPVSGGLIFGDPFGVTLKVKLKNSNAFCFSFGPDYFGSPRLQIDNIMEFNAFQSTVVRPYAGIGLAVACAKGITMFFTKEPHKEYFAVNEDNKFGFGGRAIVGLNFYPWHSKFELFIEGGPMLGFNRYHEIDLDLGIGFRRLF